MSKRKPKTKVTIRLDPEFVVERLDQYKGILSQDIQQLRQRRVSAEHNLPFFAQFKNINDYLRSFSLICMTANKVSRDSVTPHDWHPIILKYCRILGVEAESIDRMFQRIVSGDLCDKRRFEIDADVALKQLDIAIKTAHKCQLDDHADIGVKYGVSLQDAAMILNEGDKRASAATVKRWRNLRTPALPEPIGVDPTHSQRRLFELGAVLDFISAVEPPPNGDRCRKLLFKQLRAPRDA